MPSCCTVCRNNARKKKGISYFVYPKDLDRRQDWLKAVGREDLIGRTGDFRICEQHFEEKFIKYSKYKTKKYIRDEAYPTLNIPTRENMNVNKEISEATGVSLTTIKQVLSQNRLQDIDEDSKSPSENRKRKQRTIDKGFSKEGEEDSDEAPQPEPERCIRCSLCNEEIAGFVFGCVQCNVCVCGACDAQGQHAAHYVLRAPPARPQSEVEFLFKKVREQISAHAYQLTPKAVPETNRIKVETNRMPPKKSNLNNARSREARRKRVERAHQSAEQIAAKFESTSIMQCVLTDIKTEIDIDGDPLGSIEYGEAAGGSQVVPKLTEVKLEPPDKIPIKQETVSPSTSPSSRRHPSPDLDSDDSQPLRKKKINDPSRYVVLYPSHVPLQTSYVVPLKTPEKLSSLSLNADPEPGVHDHNIYLDPGIPGSSSGDTSWTKIKEE